MVMVMVTVDDDVVVILVVDDDVVFEFSDRTNSICCVYLGGYYGSGV
jgi:predicted esterase YcpF (UPF0227 family)